MKLRKTTATLLIAVLLMLSTLAVITPVLAKPQAVSINYLQNQYQWRAMYGPLSGGWSSVSGFSSQSETFTRTGNVLHGVITYSPTVQAETGTSNVYVQDKRSGDWVLREGTITYIYTPLYGPYTAVNYFRGYMQLDSSGSFVHGVLYQWIYVYEPQTAPPLIPNAVWDPVMNAWLVGISVYLQDPAVTPYTLGPPSSVPPPVPASNYNPLGK